jgi:hypothetical protein
LALWLSISVTLINSINQTKKTKLQNLIMVFPTCHFGPEINLVIRFCGSDGKGRVDMSRLMAKEGASSWLLNFLATVAVRVCRFGGGR